MKIYIDSEFRCHTTNPKGTFLEVAHSFFDGKCQTFTEGYRYVPAGENWTRSDGAVFTGEMIAPWQDFAQLDAAQREYEGQLILDMQNALHTLGVTLDE